MTDLASKWENLVIDNDGRLIDLGGPLELLDFGPPPPVVWVPVMDVGNALHTLTPDQLLELTHTQDVETTHTYSAWPDPTSPAENKS